MERGSIRTTRPRSAGTRIPTRTCTSSASPNEGINAEAAGPQPEASKAANEALAAKPEAAKPEATKPDQVATPETPRSAKEGS